MASNRERIMAYARDRQRVTLKELRQLLGVPSTTCASAVAQLVHSGKMVALGEGVYRVVDSERHRQLVRMVIFGERGTAA